MGGIGASAATLDWAMAEMVTHPAELARLQEEVDGVVGRGRSVAMEDVPALRRTKAAVKETLRMHPPSPLLLPHIAMEACEVEVEEGREGDGDGDGRKKKTTIQTTAKKTKVYKIAAGTRMLVNVWAIGNDPETWAEAERFRPERFMAEAAEIDVKGQHFELLPFGSGRRSCPAIAMATALMELALASLLHSFDWAPPPPHGGHGVDMAEKYGMVMPRRRPLLLVPVRFRLRAP
jgi:cytochrome P450